MCTSSRVDARFGFNRQPQPHRLEHGEQGLERRVAFGRERAVERVEHETGNDAKAGCHEEPDESYADDTPEQCDLATHIVDAEPKAKRRVTLSICGLGFLDELEIETISPAVKEAPDVKERM